MRLNHDCIRDILLYIEENITDSKPIIEADEILAYLQHKYDIDTINYHIRQIDKAKLVDKVSYAENVPYFICDLSWDGHVYVDNIRDNKIWNKLKDATKHLTSVSLPVLIEKAPDIAKYFIK
ncbi:DUF2513 domain-containing protein [Clostridium tyrobutyricum]|uniref:DUF2513 domain-containing protein n=1 Tax=Clostridium tyrobutyricum TaxID=1519 RepID=UPI00073D7C0D|nr:DUF2513 domain-containing protein [Clostridium tyrobutyricum]